MRSRVAGMVVAGWLAGGGFLGGEAVGQFQAYGTDQMSAYTNSWGSRFGVVGGPIVTVNGYLYPFYSPFDLNRINPSGFVNGGPVYSDWRTGYDRLDPARLYQGAPFGFGYGAWGRSRFAPPVLPMVAGPPVVEVGPRVAGEQGLPAGEAVAPVPPRLIRVDDRGEKEAIVSEEAARGPREPRIIVPGREAVEKVPEGEPRPHLILLGPPPK